jgi:hypothetical protein
MVMVIVKLRLSRDAPAKQSPGNRKSNGRFPATAGKSVQFEAIGG